MKPKARHSRPKNLSTKRIMAFCARKNVRRPSIEYPARLFGSMIAVAGDLSPWTSLGRYQHDVTNRAVQLVYP
jgi:hypothetical protein